jgi:SWIM zinc finger
MQGWTIARVNQLAPDAGSAKAGQGLANPRHWVSSGLDGDALFGECQGSGSKPYQVRIDLAEPAFKCSCPSRKFPCKHAIGLLLMHASGSVSSALKPQWVEEWIAERATRAEKKKERAEAPPKPVDVEAQAKRKENRLERVGEGLAALRLWMTDLIRTGLTSVPSRGFAFFDEQARRLVDAQAPGAARRVQMLAGIASSGAGWQRTFLEQLSSLYLLINAFERRAILDDATAETVLATLGILRTQDDVLQLPAVRDRWQILSQEVRVEDRLRAQSVWIQGMQSQQRVLILSYAHGNQPLDASLVAGFEFDGDLCLFPGHTMRGVLKSRGDLLPITLLRPLLTIDSTLDAYSRARSQNPWTEGFAIALGSVVPERRGDRWIAIDSEDRSIQLNASDDVCWTLAAHAGGRPIDVVGHYDGIALRPDAVMADRELVTLMRPEETLAV